MTLRQNLAALRLSNTMLADAIWLRRSSKLLPGCDVICAWPAGVVAVVVVVIIIKRFLAQTHDACPDWTANDPTSPAKSYYTNPNTPQICCYNWIFKRKTVLIAYVKRIKHPVDLLKSAPIVFEDSSNFTARIRNQHYRRSGNESRGF
jgi:hypothetical protein